MGWFHNWMAQRTDPWGSPRSHLESNDIRDSLPALELRGDRDSGRENNDDRNRHNGGRRGDRSEEQGGDKDKGDDGKGDKNKNNDDEDDGGKKKPPDSSTSTESPSFTTTVVSVGTPTTVVISSATFTSILTTTTEIPTMSTQTGSSATPSSFTISITTSVPESSLSTVITSSSLLVTPTTVLSTPPSASTSQGSTGAISSSDLPAGAKAGIAIAALFAFALVLGGLYVCWKRGASRTRRPPSIARAISGTQGPLVQGSVNMSQTGGRSVDDNGGKGPDAVDTSSWRTWHPYRPPSAQSNPPAAAADFLEPPAPAFSRSTHEARRAQATWDTSSEPDSSAADRFSATALATYLSPAPTRPRQIPAQQTFEQ